MNKSSFALAFKNIFWVTKTCENVDVKNSAGFFVRTIRFDLFLKFSEILQNFVDEIFIHSFDGKENEVIHTFL